MTRRVVDISDYQAGLNVDAAAATVDGVWCKVGDWAWVARYGPPGDNIHDLVIARCKQIGKPVGSYLFVRPGQTDPKTQVDWWRANCPDGTTMAPMIDLEKTVITGASLRDWVGEALDLTARAFGVTPVLYWSAAFASAYGMAAPAAAHVPMVAEYHWGYQTQLWQNAASWEAHAYSAFGGPDVPSGYGSDVTARSLIWQWTSSAQLPGFLGLVDCDLVPEAAWQQITDASLSPSSDDIEAIMADPTLSARLARYLDLHGEGGPYDQRDTYNNAVAVHQATDVAKYNWTRQDGSPVTDVALWVLNLHERMTAQSLNPIAAGVSAVDTDVKALNSAGVDVDALAAKVVAAVVAAGGLHADVDEAAIAKAAVDAFRSLFAGGTTTGSGGGDTPPATVDDVPLADPNPNVRAEVALADLTRSVFDPDAGILAVTAGQVEKMAKTADGAAPTPAQIRDAFEAASADATQRAAWLAANPPPPPPPPPATT